MRTRFRHRISYSATITSILLAAASLAAAQPRALYFQLITEEVPWRAWVDGRGFVWLELFNEELIFDGHQFTPIWQIWPEFTEPRAYLPHISGVDGQGMIWLGHPPRLARSQGRYGSLRYVNPFPDDSTRARFYAFLLDNKKRVWLGTSEGLIRYDPSTSSFTNYRHDASDPNSISSDVVPSLAQDSSGSIWAGTNNGLNRLEDEQSGQFARYLYNEELPYPESASGYFRGAFEYRLDGFDSDWQAGGTRKVATYTNLDPGNYTFRVRAFNDRIQSEREAGIEFIILTPWWMSWWAYGIYILAFTGILFAGHAYRVRRLKSRSAMLESLVAERTSQLEEQADQLVELDKAKNRFFANISHEFRTPLTMIIGPLQDAIEGVHDADPGTLRRQYQLMMRNARKLLRLINQLLDLSHLESGKLEVDLQPGDVVVFLGEITRSFAPAAERKKVSLTFSTELDSLICLSDQDKLEKVVSNLISNAIKFTPAGGKVVVGLEKVASDQPSLEIVVQDSGRGIPKKDLERIFGRFEQVD